MRIIYPHPMEFPNKKAHSIQIINTCFALAEKGIDVTLMVSKLGKKTVKECLDFYGLRENSNLRIKGTSRKVGRKKFNLFVIREIWKYRKDKNTILFFRDRKLARLFIILKCFLEIPCIVETHCPHYRILLARLNRKHKGSNVEKLKDNFRIWENKRLERFIYSNADGIICTTKGTRNTICEDFSISCPIEIICNATRISVKEFKERGSDILYLGQLYPQKGVDTLIEALKYIPERKLIIIGGNKERDIQRVKKLACEIGVNDKITFMGYIHPREVGNYLKQAGVGVIPVIDIPEARFTSPIKLFEYMSAKIPIVASNISSIREILEDGKTAVLVAPDNPEALAEGIEKILTNRQFAQEIIERAYERVKNFSYEKRADKIIRFVKKYIEHNKK